MSLKTPHELALENRVHELEYEIRLLKDEKKKAFWTSPMSTPEIIDGSYELVRRATIHSTIANPAQRHTVVRWATENEDEDVYFSYYVDRNFVATFEHGARIAAHMHENFTRFLAEKISGRYKR